MVRLLASSPFAHCRAVLYVHAGGECGWRGAGAWEQKLKARRERKAMLEAQAAKESKQAGSKLVRAKKDGGDAAKAGKKKKKGKKEVSRLNC